MKSTPEEKRARWPWRIESLGCDDPGVVSFPGVVSIVRRDRVSAPKDTIDDFKQHGDISAYCGLMLYSGLAEAIYAIAKTQE